MVVDPVLAGLFFGNVSAWIAAYYKFGKLEQGLEDLRKVVLNGKRG